MAREMKDSGIAWIGEIPFDWSIFTASQLFSQVKNRNFALQETNLLSLSYGKIKRKGIDISTGLLPESFDGYNIISKDDIVLRLTDLQNDQTSLRVGISEETGIITSAYLTIRSCGKNVAKFLFYYLYSYDIAKGFYGMGAGVRQGLNWDGIKKLKILIPPLPAQNQIVSFLDCKCAEIDIVLDKIRSSIEEYKKLKQAIIVQAVTKGIHGDRPMKDSGIEWVKQLPLEWHSINPKALFTQRKERAKESERQLTASQQYGVIYQDEYMELTGTRVVTVQKDFDILKHVEVGDFVISMRSFQGGLEYSTRSGSISSAYVMLRPNLELVYPRFFRWLLKSSLYINAIQSTSDLVRDGQAMRYSNFAQVRLYTVPMDEQKEIADYLDRKCAEIDVIIEQKSKYLSELDAYKKSLIYEYITGKKEIPQTYPESVITFVDARALLMCRIIELLKPKGRIHLMKALFCVDCLLDFNRETQYLRQKHGPYDERIEEYEKVLVQKGWASIKNGKSVDYILTETFETYREAYQIYYGSLDAEIQRICEFLRPMKTSQAERVATLLAVWNDFIIDGFSPTDKQIVQEVRSNWTPNKANSPESTWMDTLTKMKTYHITPSGYGKHTAHMNENR